MFWLLELRVWDSCGLSLPRGPAGVMSQRGRIGGLDGRAAVLRSSNQCEQTTDILGNWQRAMHASTSDRSRISVLIVEDDLPTGHALELLLRHYNYDVISANTVAAAIDCLAENPDVVLLDLMLPDGDGIQVLEAIRARQMTVSVTVLTGVGDPERLSRARRLKPDHLLQKPVDFLQILEKLPRVA